LKVTGLEKETYTFPGQSYIHKKRTKKELYSRKTKKNGLQSWASVRLARHVTFSQRSFSSERLKGKEKIATTSMAISEIATIFQTLLYSKNGTIRIVINICTLQ